MRTAKEIIAEIMDRIPCVERPGHNMLASEIVRKLGEGGYVIIRDRTDPEGGIPGRSS